MGGCWRANQVLICCVMRRRQGSMLNAVEGCRMCGACMLGCCLGRTSSLGRVKALGRINRDVLASAQLRLRKPTPDGETAAVMHPHQLRSRANGLLAFCPKDPATKSWEPADTRAPARRAQPSARNCLCAAHHCCDTHCRVLLLVMLLSQLHAQTCDQEF